MNELIYNQHNIPKKQWKYGIRSSAATGCGWIATYNALRLMGHEAEPQRLIRYFERQLPLINGTFGTFLFGPAIYFMQKGFHVKTTFCKKKFDGRVKESDVSILFYYWRKKYKFGAHFVTVRYEDGQFVGYNTYRNSTGPDKFGNSLEEYVRGRKLFGSVVFGIREI